jgi:Hr1 repeat
MDDDELIHSVYRKIEREKALINAASNMRQSTDNPLVQQRVDASIRDGRKNIAYLEEKMRELQLRRMGQEGGGSPSPQTSPHPTSPIEHRRSGGARGLAPPPPPKDYLGDYGDPGSGGYGQGGADSMPAHASYADSRPFAPVPKARPNYSKLGMFDTDTQVCVHLDAEINPSYMIHQT